MKGQETSIFAGSVPILNILLTVPSGWGTVGHVRKDSSAMQYENMPSYLYFIT